MDMTVSDECSNLTEGLNGEGVKIKGLELTSSKKEIHIAHNRVHELPFLNSVPPPV